MSEDILHRKQLETSDMTFDFTSEIYNYTLVIIEDLCVLMANKPLQDLGMPSPNRIAAVSTCVGLDREQSYSTSDLLSYVQNNISKLTSEQKDIYDTIDSISGRIQLPADFCNLVTSKNELIEKVFPNILKNYKNNKWLCERAIFAPKNIDVHEINNIVLTKIRDQAVLYKSVDTVSEPNEAVNYPSEFLNSIDLSGFPPHVLQLKIGVPIILLRNINPPKLCNGTRLAVKNTMENLIEATILTGPFEGEAVLIPRIPMIPTDLPFQFKRLQFPIRLAFAITINKAQGQSLEKCGIDLNTDCFSHGQLYVACSRVGKPDNLFICSDNWTAKNVVYSQVLRS